MERELFTLLKITKEDYSNIWMILHRFILKLIPILIGFTFVGTRRPQSSIHTYASLVWPTALHIYIYIYTLHNASGSHGRRSRNIARKITAVGSSLLPLFTVRCGIATLTESFIQRHAQSIVIGIILWWWWGLLSKQIRDKYVG